MPNTSSGYTTVDEKERSTQVRWTMSKSFQERVRNATIFINSKRAKDKQITTSGLVKARLLPFIEEIERQMQEEQAK
jgi:hypothetical protein